MKLLVRFRNKETAFYELVHDSFTPPGQHAKGFFKIGQAKEGGHPVMVNLDDVVAFEPQPEDSGAWIG